MNPKWEHIKFVPPDRLTPRQREVAQGLAESRTPGELAESMGLATKTVEGHRVELERALGLKVSHTLALSNLALITRWAICHHLTHV